MDNRLIRSSNSCFSRQEYYKKLKSNYMNFVVFYRWKQISYDEMMGTDAALLIRGLLEARVTLTPVPTVGANANTIRAHSRLCTFVDR